MHILGQQQLTCTIAQSDNRGPQKAHTQRMRQVVLL